MDSVLSNTQSIISLSALSDTQFKNNLGIPLIASEIIAVTITRNAEGAPGFSIRGSGEKDDPVKISELTPYGPAWKTGKLQVFFN